MARSTPLATDFELITIAEGPHLEWARLWASRRRAYIHHTFEAAPNKKYVGVFDNIKLLSVISIELTGEAEYLLHVTSPRRSDLRVIGNAVYQVGWSLFNDLHAESIYTHRPIINGHEHRGSTAMCEMTGLHPYGLPEEEEINGVHYSWQVYQMTRLDWLIDHQKPEAA